LAKAAEAVEKAVAASAKLDARTLRADFPIFQQRVHGKPLAYLDSAVSAQKPRQVLDAQRGFYETSYTNVHRGVFGSPLATCPRRGSTITPFC
jgi:cysteine desulfurase/selenocysteine lyase